MRERWPRLFAAGVIVSWLFASGVLHAQPDLSHINDANTVPRGLLRLRAITAWTRYDTRFTASVVEPLGAPFSAAALGAAQMPALTATEALVQSATESP